MDWHMKSFHFETSKWETLEEETFNLISVLEENHDVHAHLETSIEMDVHNLKHKRSINDIIWSFKGLKPLFVIVKFFIQDTK